MLTPEEITARRFLVSLRGYDRDEVHAFLDQVAEELRSARARVDQLEDGSGGDGAPAVDRRAGGGDPGAVFAGIGRETQRILEAAHAAAAEIVQHAQDEADRGLAEVRQQIGDELADGQRRLNAVEESLSGLAASRSEVAGELRDVQRTIEHVLRELVPPDEHTVSVREALAAQARAQLPGGQEEDDVFESERNPATDGAATSRIAPSPMADEPSAELTELTEPAPEPSEMTELAEPTEMSAEQEPAVVVEPDESATVSPAVQGDQPPEQDSGQDLAARASDAPASHEDAGALRSEVLGPLHPRMSRSVKRGLQDLQNRLLSVLRAPDGLQNADDVNFDNQDLDGLADLVDEELQRAYRAGVDAAHVLAEGAAETPSTRRTLAREFARHATERSRSPVVATLRLGVGAGEHADELVDRVTAVFSELRASTAAELAATHLIRAYELGLLDAWAAGETKSRRWVIGPEARCPENRCQGNEQAGLTAVEDVFPSGHEAPPVHVGCTCTTVPGQGA